MERNAAGFLAARQFRTLEAMLQSRGLSGTLEAGLARRWSAAIEDLAAHTDAQVRPLLTRLLDSLTQPGRALHLAYDDMRRAIRQLQLRHAMAQADGAAEIGAVRRMMETAPDPRSRGHLFEEYMRRRLRGARDRAFAGLRSHRGDVSRAIPRTRRSADDVLDVVARPREGGPWEPIWRTTRAAPAPLTSTRRDYTASMFVATLRSMVWCTSSPVEQSTHAPLVVRSRYWPKSQG